MNQTVLIAGGMSPINTYFSAAAEKAGHKVLTADSSRTKGTSFSWNPASPISARSIVLQAENTFETIGTSIITFDADFYEDSYSRFCPETISRGVDNTILGYMYILSELQMRLEKYGEGNIVFFHSSSAEKEKGLITSAASAAFMAFAEKAASLYAGKPAGVILVKTESEVTQETADWLFQYLSQPAAQKSSLSAKHAAHWLKPGSKPPVMLPFLSR